MKKRSADRLFILLMTVFCVTVLIGSTTVTARAEGGAPAAAASVDTGSVLYGKSALFCGDSICQGAADKTTESKRGWAGRIELHYGMIVTNSGRIAATVSIAQNRGINNRIVNQIESVKANTYDYVILHGGVNDAMSSIAVGRMTDSSNVADFDPSTFAGALEELFYRAREYFGNKTHIGYIVNYQTPMSNWGGATRDMSEYVKVAVQICDKWEISCLDLYDDQDFNENVMKVSTKENLMDFLHPNKSGYDLLGVKIGTWMETMSQDDSRPLPWIIGGAVLVVVIAAIIVLIVVKRKRRQQAVQ